MISLSMMAMIWISCTLVTTDAQNNSRLRCQQVNGTINGGRCFFTPSISSTWSDAWTTCQKEGAVLAQIHTAQEYDAVFAWMNQNAFPIPGSVLWLAFQRDNRFDMNVSCPTAQEYTYWYDNATSQNPLMRADNTWMRYHVCDENDLFLKDYCMMWYVWAQVIVDSDCMSQFQPLCQFNILEQSYTLTNVCMTEQPFEVFLAAQPCDCATVCTQTMWCRGFNFKMDLKACTNHTCELFSWSTLDQCPQCANTTAAPTNKECVHYTYVP